MCGRFYAGRKAGSGGRRGSWGPDGGSAGFFGLDVEKMDPKAQMAAAISVLGPAALAGIVVAFFVPQLFWLFFVFGWAIFPAVGLLAKGLAGMSEAGPERVPEAVRERELLEALREHGELTPARAAMETSLSVAEADRMLGELAEGGHLEVRVRGGGLYYSLWETGEQDGLHEPEAR